MRSLEIRNRILTSLRPEAQEFIHDRIETRRIFAGETLYESGAPISHVIFPHDGVISYMADDEDIKKIEKASVGYEGYIGFSLVMRHEFSLSRSVVQVPGYASWLSRENMNTAVERFECLRDAMLRYATFLIGQLMETVACNSLHSAEQRVTRWLLQAHDRVHGDRFPITQKAIGDILGLRRATVSEVCSRLQAAGVIDYSRGILDIRQREALKATSCDCYARIKLHYGESESF